MSRPPVFVQRRLKFVAGRHQRDSDSAQKALFKPMQTYCCATNVACVKEAQGSYIQHFTF